MRSPSPTITNAEKKVLLAIRSYILTYGFPPSYRNIMEDAGITSSSVVRHYLLGLERRGYLERMEGCPRAMRLTDKAVAI